MMQHNESPTTAPLPPLPEGEKKTTVFHPRNLFDLFFRPRRFFARMPTFEHKPYIYICVLLSGFTRVVPYYFSEFENSIHLILLDLLFALFASAIGGVIAWYLLAGWYQIRIVLSGAIHPDGFVARQVFFYSGLVTTLPTLLLFLLNLVLPTERDIPWQIALLTLLASGAITFWGCFVSYIGVRRCFQTPMERTALWFIILPILLSAIILLPPRFFS